MTTSKASPSNKYDSGSIQTLRFPEDRAGSIGDRFSIRTPISGTRVYEKSRNGRWGLVITSGLREQILRLYGMGISLQRVRDLLLMPGHPSFSHTTIKQVVDEAESMRGKGIGPAREAYVQKNLHTLRTLRRQGVTIEELCISLNLESQQLGTLSSTCRRPGRPNRSADALLLSSTEYESWNSALELDLSETSFVQYKSAVRTISEFVMSRTGCAERRSRSRHVDHKLSIFHGYFTEDSVPSPRSDGSTVKTPRGSPIPLAVMCHPSNLRIVDSVDNCTKNFESLLTEFRLRNLVSQSDFQISRLSRSGDVRSLIERQHLRPFVHE